MKYLNFPILMKMLFLYFILIEYMCEYKNSKLLIYFEKAGLKSRYLRFLIFCIIQNILEIMYKGGSPGILVNVGKRSTLAILK